MYASIDQQLLRHHREPSPSPMATASASTPTLPKTGGGVAPLALAALAFLVSPDVDVEYTRLN